MDVIARANQWLSSPIDQEDKDKITELLKSEHQEELTDAFYKDLEFGTGGLRGIMGIGSNRMNKYTVAMATQGLANYLILSFKDDISVAIAHDCRNNSKFFAETVAEVFIGNGIKVYLFEDLRPTPELSFTIRHLKCNSGVVITASHNPKEYNGYKVYWDDGAQITSPHDHNIISEVRKIDKISEINFGVLEKAHFIGKDIDEIYTSSVLQLTDPTLRKDIKIVYSSLHGAGITLIPPLLSSAGYEVSIVEEQAMPDGNFPTVISPNPEENEAMTLALKKAMQINADIAMATDPDSDRVGIGIPNHEGNFELLNSNQSTGRNCILITYKIPDHISITFFTASYKHLFLFKVFNHFCNMFKARKCIITFDT